MHNVNVGDSITETFNVTSIDGTPSTVKITIEGTNDAAVVSSADVTLTETNAPLTTGGTLTATDVDNADNSFTPATVVGTYGTFTLQGNGEWTFTANSAFDALNVGDSITETFNVTSIDGTPSTVKITIEGTNDAAVVSSADVTLTETNAPLTTGGTLTATDVDNADNSFTPATVVGTYGTFTLQGNGEWTFTANSAFDALNVGDSITETFNVTSIDGTPSTVKITIEGTNDAAVVSSADVTLTETNAPLTTGGTLTATDVDNADNSFTPATVVGTYGTFTLQGNGEWTFTANSAFDALNVGDSITETFNVTSIDGTPSTVKITIEGTNDAAVVSSADVTLTETNAPLTTGGTLTATDVDNADNSFTPATVVGTYGTFTLQGNGEWTFTANSAFDALNVGDSITETFNVTSIDGTPSTVKITIEGTNDAAVVSSADVTLTETNAPLTTGGTLTATDVDNADNSFTPATVVGTYGTFTLQGNGEWTFTANSAFDALNVGDSITETFNVTSIDGTPSTVKITIEGTNDAAVVSSADVTLTETNAPLTTGGTLTATDVDNADNSFTPATVVGTYGTFTLQGNGEWTFTANSAFDALNVGDSITETFNVTSIDGTPSTVKITIEGTNDAAVVSSADVTLTETNAPLTTGGTLTATDVDNADNSFTPATVVGTYGTFTLQGNGEWTFTANSAFDALNVGDSITETFNVTSIDGTPSTVKITIEGTNDAAVVSSADVTLTETNAPLTTGGTLTATDVDNADNSFTPATVVGTYGTFTLQGNGEWTFTANSAFDALNVGDSITETFNVTSIDGTPSTVKITIEGTNDAAVVSSADVTLTETNAPLTTGGTLTATDVDNADNSFTPATVVGTYGTFTLQGNGEWTFTANSAFDALNVGDSITETFNVTSIDGTPSTVKITIEGTNDAAVVSSADVTLTETNAPLTTGGTLTATDVDNADNSFTPATVVGTYGTFTLQGNGEWTFTANSAFDALNVGDSITETFNVTSIDGTPSTVKITIEGTNDAAVVSSADVTLTETNAPLTTGGTLTATDVDNADNSFTPATVVGTYGTFTLQGNGEWTFTANSAFDALNVGDSITETFNVTSIDGTPSTVKITIEGTNDAAVVSSADVTLTETNAPLTTGGTLTATDVDNADNSFTPATVVGTYGTFTLQGNGEWTFTANSAFDALNVGDSITETFNVTSIDGTPSTVKITIEGTNDAAVVSSADVTLTETNAPLTTGGTLTATDVDNADNSFTPATVVGTYGTFTLQGNGEWTFTANSAFDALNVGDSITETFNVTSIDGTPSTVKITIEGTNDAAVVSSADVTLTETNAPLTTGGTLTATDVDNADNSFTPATVVGTYGTFTLQGNGEWTFTANSAFDALNVGDSITETFNVTSIDGTPSTVKITIEGTNDAAVVSSADVTLTETNAPLTTGGTLTATDVDNADNSFTPATVVGTYGTFTLQGNGEWTFTANSAFDALNVGDSITETFNVTSIDGTPSTVKITIEGTNDAAVVSSADVTLTETNAPLTTGGTLTATDVDNADNSFTPATVVGTYGTFTLQGNGEWTFTANSAFDALNVGDSITETFNVTSIDGTPSTVKITIEGTNDAAVVSSADVTLTETNAPLTTGGTLTATDVDNADNSFTPATVVGTYGTFTLQGNGEWTFTANSAFDALNVGDSITETFNVTSIDGTPSTVKITIEGTNDAAVVSSADVTLTETNAPLTTGGTLTATDVDNADNSFTPATVVGTYGTFTLQGNGEWTFTANSAFDALNVGDSITETFNVTSIDGTPSTVKITIEGTNDAAVVSSADVTLTETNAPLTTGGTLTATDVDNADNSFTPATVVGTYGTFTLQGNGEWTFTANSAFDALNVGDSITETFNVTSIDGTPSTVKITIEGTNDAAVVSSADVTLTETNAPLTTGGTLTATDVDNADNSFTPATVVGTYGTFTLQGNGEWTFTANSAFDALNVGDSITETFNVTSIDGTPSTVKITIEGTNDAAVVSSADVTLTETNAPLTTGGTLTATDVDNADNSFTPATVVGTYGTFTLQGNGEWTFTANSAFDALNVGDSITETFNVTSIDGTPSTVKITIEGTNDAAVVSSADVTLTETNAPLTTGGTLTATDVDNADNSFTPATVVGTYGTFTLQGNGEWTFTANSAFDALNVGDSITETFNVTSIDGTPSTVKITIEGTNDAAVVSSADVTLTETNAPLTTGGTLTATDVDNADNSFTPATVVGTYGTFTLQGNGEWTFTANSAFDALNVGDSITETFNVTSIDGTPSTVKITIEGTNDAAVVSSADVTLTETNAPLTTGGTLTATDVDNADNSFTPATVVGTYGTFTLQGNGEWTFTANSAFDALNVGDSITETFNVTSIDGTPSTVKITIEGTNDAAVVSSADVTLTETNAPLTTGGTLTATDVDNADNSFTPATVVGTYGTFTLQGNGEWTFTANSAFDALNVGDSITETFNVTSIDGTPSTVKITIEGTNDAAVVSSADVTLTETNAPLTTGGTLTATDVDNADNSFTPATVVGTYGTFTLQGNGEWTFTANSAFDALNVGDSITETFNVTSIDGTPSTVKITIEGTNDAAVVSSADVTLTETNAPLTTGGTLTATDVDNADNSFTPATVVGTYGTFTLQGNGEWTFTANSAFDALNVGDSITETFNVTSIDGTPSTVKITIEGTNDAAVVSSADVTLTETNAPLTTGGTLTATDVDNADNSFTPATVVGTYGTFTLQGNGEWTFTANSAFDALNVGDSITETFNVTSIDGTPSTVKITIEGTNDAAVVSSADVTLTETNAPLTTGGTLTATDVDNADNSFTPATVVGTYGTFTLQGNGEWTFTANSAFDALNVGDSITETFNVTSIDGTPSTVKITIEGTNDAAVVSSADVTLTETNAPLTTGGTLTATDVDNADNSFTPATVVGTYGTFTLQGNGEWTFTANSAFDALNVGDSITETFNVTSIDGTPSTVKITIEGTNDAAVVSSADVTLTETNAPLTTGGTLTATDVDNADNSFTPATVVGTYGTFTLQGNGEWTFTANSAFDALNVGDSITETFNVTSIDGTPSTVKITIEGTNDAAVVSSADVTLTETNAPLTTGGTLTATDVDNADNSFTPATVVGTYGTFTLQGNGEWTFTANSAFDALNVGDSITETFNVTSIDGTPSTVKITIEGTNDAAVVSSADVTLTETNAPLTTGGTLTATDVDNADNSFTPATVVGTYGTFTLQGNGEWTFTANSAFDALNVGDSITETFNVTSIDGTPSTVKITIEGTNDAAVVSSADVTLTETNAPLTTGGTLTATDVDNADNSFTPATVVGTYGTFTLQGNGEWTFTANSAFDALNVGDSITETFNVTSIDGTPSTVKITIEGTNDAAVVSSADVTLTETNAPLTTGGTLTATDVDNADNSFTPATVVGTYGTFTLQGNGEWTFTANSAFDALNVGDSITETFNVTSIDGTPSTVKITIEGTNDAAVVSSADVTLTETNAPLTTGGTLTATDVDNADNSFTPATVVGTYGTFTLQGNGEWTFTANSAFDALNVGDSITETFNVTSIDGTPSTVKITIEGTNDAAVVSSADVTLTETNAPLTTGGTLTATDVDNADNSFTPATVVGTYGTFTLQGNGEWTFTANSAFDALNVGDSITETFNVTSIDGTPSTVKITIEGTNDAAVVSSADVTLTETNAPLTTGGTLTATDVDNADNSFTPATVVGTYGTFTLQGNGEWTFTANSAFDALNVGDSITETFNVTSIDGTPSTVKITIEGTNDAAVVSSADVTLTETNAPLTTGGTLTATDVDNADNSFTPATVVGTYGTFTLQGNGEWTFTANSAFDALNVGDSITETFNVTSIDGTPSTVKITIEGTNDAAVVSSADVTLTETNAPLTTGGTLTATDVDNADNSFTPATVVGTYGTFTLQGNGEWTFTANSAFDALNVGDSITETFNVTSIDGTPSTVKITIEGTNDAAVVSSADVTLTETNAPLTTGGTLTATDVDNADNSFTPATVVGTYGTFTLQGNGEWTFTANSAFDALNVGDSITETFNVTSIDGTPSTVKITIEGTNDAAVVSSADVTLTETNAPLTTGGTLTATDVDNADNSFTPATVVGTYGTFTLQGNGEWTFTANSAFDALNVGDSITETFNVTSIDGTPSTVKITIEGTNDAAVVSSADVTLTETNAPLTTGGTLTATDVDNADNSFTPATVVGTYGTFTLQGNGEWTFTANSAFDALNVGDSITETFNVTSIDGTPSTVKITIEGTNDAAVVSSADVTLTETNAPLTTGGTLTATDVDNADNSFTLRRSLAPTAPSPCKAMASGRSPPTAPLMHSMSATASQKPLMSPVSMAPLQQ
ncbi:hypothetical protein LFREDSHE_44130 [Shewanella baltica]